MKRTRTLSIISSLLLAACTGGSGGGLASLSNTHVHGLAVDRGDSSRVYIATHHGLLVWQEGQGLTQVGNSRDDFMGFSPHPSDPNILMSSGHPSRGGNLGFLKSENAGKTWTKVSNGNPGGPADFHTMTVHPVNPNHIYGWYKLRIHRSLDQGKTWEVLPNQPPEILAFAGDLRDDKILYAGSIGDLLMTTDRFETFVSIAPAELTSDIVFDIEIDPVSGTLILATRDHGIVYALGNVDGGWNFETIGKLPGGDPAYYLALDPKNPEILYAFTKGHVLYKSTDGGKTWQKLL